MDGQLIAQLFGAGAIATIFTTAITLFVQRKKLGAEATSIISQAAGGLVENLAKDNTRLRADMAVLEAKLADAISAATTASRKADRQGEDLESMKRQRRKMQRMFDQHNESDELMWNALNSAGITVPKPAKLVWPDDDME